ncbi:MAG: chorismate synthase [Anaerovoracaceae bacterium]|jgi:chorismate synthase|nr:chorismate synthase [Anaerovoracaceae bacterium]
MSFSIGTAIRITIFGESHGKALGVIIDGLPSGEDISWDLVNQKMKRRVPGLQNYTTARKEKDEFEVLSGISGDRTNGGPLSAIIRNQDTRSGDYHNLNFTPRPMHGDYPAAIKYKEGYKGSGGSFFSGRMTAPLVLAGAILTSILEKRGINIGGHIYSIGEVQDTPWDPLNLSKDKLQKMNREFFPLESEGKVLAMKMEIEKVQKEGDSIGGVVECGVTGLPVGVGQPFFEGLESVISQVIFSIPGVKALEFGSGFKGTTMRGSQHNDSFQFEEDKIITRTNNHGGILGGLSTGMPLILRAGFKPTASIFIDQDTVNLKTRQNTKIKIKGRHDPCIVPRGLVCVEAAVAIAISELMMKGKML